MMPHLSNILVLTSVNYCIQFAKNMYINNKALSAFIDSCRVSGIPAVYI